MDSIPKIEFYICTGGNGIYYTLRKLTSKGQNIKPVDVFVKNLSVSKVRAIASALSYCDSLRKTAAGKLDVVLDITPRQATINLWGDGKLSFERLDMLRHINEGVMPYGLHKGKQFGEIPSDYLAWACSEALKKNETVTVNVASAAFCVLMDRGEISDYQGIEKLLIPKNEIHAKSDFIGLLNTRQEISATIEYCKKTRSKNFNRDTYFYKLKVGDDVVVYSGSAFLGNVSESVKLKANIEGHVCYHNIKSTVIKRPRLI